VVPAISESAARGPGVSEEVAKSVAAPPPIDYEQMAKRLEVLGGGYQSASPFPHFVIDDFLTSPWPDRIIEEFPEPTGMEIQFRNEFEVKSASSDWDRMGAATRAVIAELNSGPFIALIEQVTGISGLIPDPHLWGGGLHQIRRGGRLGIHADFNRHERLRLDRRLNLIIYLNREWQDDWGGELELWDRNMTHRIKSVCPSFNRCVLFATNDFSFHGHPDPLSCPEGVTRKSLALYYYSNGRPADDISSSHSTLFQQRPGTSDAKQRRTARVMVHSVIPPIALQAARAVRARWREGRESR
jgi:hypothetical protein